MTCASCGAARPAAAALERQRGERRAGRWRGVGAIETDPLCAVCLEWLLAVVDAAHRTPGTSPLIGAPAAPNRPRVADECVICREPTSGSAELLRLATPEERARTSAVAACTPCGTWIAGLARDGRSARGTASRSLDGPYGDWLHPNLRALRSSIVVRDQLAYWAIAETLRAMEVRVVGPGEDAEVRFVEAGLARDDRGGPAQRILLAAPAAAAHLLRELQAGAAGWLTLPATPQQITAVLTHLRRGDTPRAWNPRLGLAEIEAVPPGQPGVIVTPLREGEGFELAWMLKRFARGYDEVVSLGGEIVVMPRVPPSQLAQVGTRLERLLEGRATLLPMSPERQSPAARLNLAG